MNNRFEIRGDITVIFLNRKNGGVLETLIDTADLEKAQSFNGKWYARWDKDINSFYVNGTGKRVNGKQTSESLHRWLMDNPKGFYIDHVNHDTLNNTRKNLRIVTPGQNNQNLKGAKKTNKCGTRGIRFNERVGKWEPRLQINRKPIYLGYFNTKEDAERAVIEARKEYMPFSNEGGI